MHRVKAGVCVAGGPPVGIGVQLLCAFSPGHTMCHNVHLRGFYEHQSLLVHTNQPGRAWARAPLGDEGQYLGPQSPVYRSDVAELTTLIWWQSRT